MGRMKSQSRPGKYLLHFTSFRHLVKTGCFPYRNCNYLGKEKQDKFMRTKITHIATFCAEILAKERLLHCCIWSGLSFPQTETPVAGCDDTGQHFERPLKGL